MAGGMAAGATAGSAFGPWGTAIGAGVGALTDIMGSSSSAPAGPSMAYSGLAPITLDHSGWNVATGGSRLEGTYAKTDGTMPADAGKWVPWMIAAVVVLYGLKQWRKK